MAPLHPIQRRVLAEELTRLRRADEQQRYAASQRRGRIDPNPHQIDAVIFALRRIRDGGCILADEVGLGKTIEAGLIMAQLLAEGARRVLLIVPKPLLGQWQVELRDLFGLEAREGRADPEAFIGDGVFLVGREFAGSEKGASLLRTTDPFDLCVIDEAHEVFAGIYKRYDKHGNYELESGEARMAHRVRSAIGQAPVLLLTATPIQNSLTELWGLVQYVEPTGTLLGKLPTFRQVFCDGDDRTLIPGQAHELKRRLGTVLQRTLRRQAQEFLEKPFVDRRARLFDYPMSTEERALYDDVTAYLLEPELCAFRGNQRRLLLIGFHRRMASSLRALASSLSNVADRLRRQRDGLPEATAPQTALAFALDLEDDLEEDEEEKAEDEETEASKKRPPPSRARVEAELRRVEGFIRRAEALPQDSKAVCLIDALRLVLERGRLGDGSGKVVVFTESLTTQDYLEQLLVEHGGLSADDVTLFRGQNESPRVQAAVKRWDDEVGAALPPSSRPSRPVAVRLALVHEFRTRSKVFVSTEAGAKGLNLQFCDTIINYDLPWNPQRIEQRIGRCHRYGQTRDVTVINFLARDNETQRLTFEILSQKLELFGQVLDASDAVLHRPERPEADAPGSLVGALGADFASKLRRIYERARTVKEIEDELRALRESLGAERKAFDEALSRTSGLIQTRFDDGVRQVFRRYQQELPAGLARLDRDLERLLTGYLDALGVAFERRDDAGRVLVTIPPSARLPEGLRDGAAVAIGASKGLEGAEPLHLGHPLVLAAVAEARAATTAPLRVQLRARAGAQPPGSVAAGARGRLVVTKVTYRGFEAVERLFVTALLEGGAGPLDARDAEALLQLAAADVPAFASPIAVAAELVDDAVDEATFQDQAQTTGGDQARFERMLEQIERYVEDQVLVLRREVVDLDERIGKASARRDVALAADVRKKHEADLVKLETRKDELEGRIERLEAREDPDYVGWRAKAHERRYTPPVVARVLDVEFALA